MRIAVPLFFLIICLSCANDDQKITPERQNMAESVYASLTVQPDSMYQVYSAVAGILENNVVEEGDLVTKGTPLLQIINTAPKLNKDNARLALDLARENYQGNAAVLKGIEDEIQAAQLQFHNDSVNFFRQKNLWEQNIGSKVDFDSKKLQYELSSNKLSLLESRLDRTRNELLSTLRQAENNYQSALVNTQDFTVESKINGKVYALYKNRGELVNSAEPLAAVGSASDFILELLVDEVDIVKVSIGQKVIIVLDAYGDQVFDGRVSKILPKKDERNQTFKVEALFNNLPDKLFPGLSGEANIIVAEREMVLTIPVDYLVDGNQVRTEDGLITVEVGIQNLEIVEIRSGIDENTMIYKPER